MEGNEEEETMPELLLQEFYRALGQVMMMMWY
jgi:hypothetical protein